MCQINFIITNDLKWKNYILYERGREESQNEKNREKRRCEYVDIGPVGGSATPTLYKSLFLPATCSVFQFERRAACDYLQESSSLSSYKGDRSHTMPYWEKILVKMLRRATAALFTLVRLTFLISFRALSSAFRKSMSLQ